MRTDEVPQLKQVLSDGSPIVLLGCFTGSRSKQGDSTWNTFSKDGEFSADHTFAQVSGFPEPEEEVVRDACYEMAVIYIRHADVGYCKPKPGTTGLEACGQIKRGNTWEWLGGTTWSQPTPQFVLVEDDSYRRIPLSWLFRD